MQGASRKLYRLTSRMHAYPGINLSAAFSHPHVLVSCARHVAVWKTSNRAELDAGANKSQYNNGYRFRHSAKLGPVCRKGLTCSANPQLQETNSHALILFKRFQMLSNSSSSARENRDTVL